MSCLRSQRVLIISVVEYRAWPDFSVHDSSAFGIIDNLLAPFWATALPQSVQPANASGLVENKKTKNRETKSKAKNKKQKNRKTEKQKSCKLENSAVNGQCRRSPQSAKVAKVAKVQKWKMQKWKSRRSRKSSKMQKRKSVKIWNCKLWNCEIMKLFSTPRFEFYVASTNSVHTLHNPLSVSPIFGSVWLLFSDDRRLEIVKLDGCTNATTQQRLCRNNCEMYGPRYCSVRTRYYFTLHWFRCLQCPDEVSQWSVIDNLVWFNLQYCFWHFITLHLRVTKSVKSEMKFKLGPRLQKLWIVRESCFVFEFRDFEEWGVSEWGRGGANHQRTTSEPTARRQRRHTGSAIGTSPLWHLILTILLLYTLLSHNS